MVCQKKKKKYQKCYHEREDGNMKNVFTKARKNKYKSQSSVMTLLIDKKEIVKKFMSKEKLKEN